MSDEYEFSISAQRKKHREAGGSRHTNGNGKSNSRANPFRNDAESRFDEEDQEAPGGWTRPNAGGPGQKGQRQTKDRRAPRELHYPPEPEETAKEDGFRFPFDPWRLLAALKRRWMIVVGASLGLGLLFLIIASAFLDYKVTVKLWRRETSNAFRTGDPNGQSSLPREMSEQTLFKMMRSGEVLRRVSEKSNPHVSADHLAKSVAIVPTQDPDILTVTLAGKGNLKNLVNLANLYAAEVVDFTKEIQSSESKEVNLFLKKRLDEMDSEVAKAKAKLSNFSREAGVLNYEKDVDTYVQKLAAVDARLRQAELDRETMDYRIAGLKTALNNQTPTNDKLEAAKEELNTLLNKYTEEHPLVKAQRAKLAVMEKQGTNIAAVTATNELKAPGTVLGNGFYMQIVDLDAQKGAG
ncbi:MAG: polysaccharide export protein, partial [Verrucomicrobiales bacterium]|nr:polysaccharide export protein [Verrucomicrobiales bacterium]